MLQAKIEKNKNEEKKVEEKQIAKEEKKIENKNDNLNKEEKKEIKNEKEEIKKISSQTKKEEIEKFTPNPDSIENNKETPIKPNINEEKKSDDINEYNVVEEESGVEEIIIKDSEYNKYIEKLYSVFILWSLSIDIDYPLYGINLDKSIIKNINTLEILFLLNKQIKNNKLIINFLNSINSLANNSENCYQLFFTKNVFSSILDLTFEYYKLKGKDEETIFNLSKNILITSFINSFSFCLKQQNQYPGKELENIFIWGNKILEENKNKKDILLNFIFELFSEFLIQFKLKYDPKIILDSKESSYNVEKNYYFKNYLYFMNIIYVFSFRFSLAKNIHKNGISNLYSSSPKINIPQAIIDSMRINENLNKNIISQCWLDFPLLSDVLNRIRHIWSKKNIFKNLTIDKYKNNKASKYQYIIERIIINKEIKNLYQKELVFLCFEDKKGGFEYINPLINLVPLTLICIIHRLKNADENKDFRYWLKEFKNFIRFLIIASSNLTKINQIELYSSIQDKCLDVISAGLCFLYNLLFSDSKYKDKIQNSLDSLLLLCFKLVKYQFNYRLKHSKIFNFAAKPARNDLQECAVCRLFNDYIKDKTGNPIMTLNKLEEIPLESNNFASSINGLIIKQDFVSAFWENEALKSKLNNSFYSLTPYKKMVDYRYDLIPFLGDNFNNTYKESILQLLPKYENELAKYSNNSLEKNIKFKNRYKVFKKNAFSWRGYWSCREDFFQNNSKFKYKLINHYTKTFMKPILVPIIDISYYLPEFSGFDPKNLFKEEKNENEKNKFKLNLDIDKVLKAYEQNTQDNTNITSREKEESEDNYLLRIYKKSNPILYKILLNIANNLEFGKEEEFVYVEREEISKKKKKEEIKKVKKYFLSCLVKTSHHIKGVCFIDDKKLKFKVFLNQRTGSAMSGVEVGFTNKDDDYDQERKTCFGSFFVCHPKDKDLYKIGIEYKNIKWIFKRKYYYSNSALEIFTTTNKTFYFNFKYEKDRNIVLNEILKKLDEPIPIIDDLKESNVEHILGYENGLIQKKKGDKIHKNIKLSKIIKSWKNWEMTNFEFLMWLNIFGNRSYNDISQYPIFPWILSNYEDPLQVEQKVENKRTFSMSLIDPGESLNATYTGTISMLNNINDFEEQYVIDYQYRNMNLPMGMLELSEEGIKRKQEFDLNYETLLELGDENNKPYVFGSNYSNPIYVCNYLMRLFPFTHISIELQGQGFDKPDRLFLSVKNSFFNSTSQKGDVRELIPEFFYLPEMFRNINKLNMGKLENGEEVNDVITPCHNNPYDFIMTMKSVLENNVVSYTIQNWIDLIFGYKAKGKEADAARNIFKEASYQEDIDLNKIEDKDIKESKLREVEFGLVPNQLMLKECNKKDKKELIRRGKEITDSTCDLQSYKCKYHNENEKLIIADGLIITKFACFGQEKITYLLGGTMLIEKKITYSSFDKSYYDEAPNRILIRNYPNKMSDFYNPKKPNSKAIQFCHKGKTLILGGFYDGKIMIYSLDPKFPPRQAVPLNDKLPILAVAVDQEDEFAFFGNSIGNIRIMKMNIAPSNWKFSQIITDHLSPISYINCNSELNLWASASVDGYINLYTLPLSKLIRSLKVPTRYCDYVFLSSSPLPSIIAIGEENKVSEIFVYSINGKLLIRQKEQSLITCPIIIKDLNSNEYLAYIINESIIIRSIPTLIRQVSTDEISDIYAIFPSEDMKIMYGTNKYGNQIYVIKDQIKKM